MHQSIARFEVSSLNKSAINVLESNKINRKNKIFDCLNKRRVKVNNLMILILHNLRLRRSLLHNSVWGVNFHLISFIDKYVWNLYFNYF